MKIEGRVTEVRRPKRPVSDCGSRSGRPRATSRRRRGLKFDVGAVAERIGVHWAEMVPAGQCIEGHRDRNAVQR